MLNRSSSLTFCTLKVLHPPPVRTRLARAFVRNWVKRKIGWYKGASGELLIQLFSKLLKGPHVFSVGLPT